MSDEALGGRHALAAAPLRQAKCVLVAGSHAEPIYHVPRRCVRPPENARDFGGLEGGSAGQGLLELGKQADTHSPLTVPPLLVCAQVSTGLVFAFSTNFWVLVVAGTLGVISPSGNEVGPFLAIEQAGLTQTIRWGREGVGRWLGGGESRQITRGKEPRGAPGILQCRPVGVDPCICVCMQAGTRTGRACSRGITSSVTSARRSAGWRAGWC